MEIIVTHDMADFDAFAATVAAQLLYPSAIIVLGRRLSHEVREYLTLHKDRFRTAFYTELDPTRVRHLIIVDVRRKSRLQDFAEVVARGEAGEIQVSVYDHHPAAEDDVRADHLCVARVGSATTLLVELMRERGEAIDAVTAMLSCFAGGYLCVPLPPIFSPAQLAAAEREVVRDVGDLQ